MDYSKDLNKLVNEMGFNRMEAQMALEESRGDINIATNKLTSGAYAPPPYAPVSEKAAYPSHQASIAEKNRIDDPSKLNFSNVLGNITGKHNAPIVEDKPSAPSFTSLTHDLQKIQIELPEGTKQMPPPYEVIDKSNKVKAWEKDANVFHFDCSQSSSSPSASRKEQPIYLQQGERCDVCFNILEGTTNILSQNKKVSYTVFLYIATKYFNCCDFLKEILNEGSILLNYSRQIFFIGIARLTSRDTAKQACPEM